jgi:hypothetical protein
LRSFVSEYIIGRPEQDYVILSGYNYSLVKIKHKILVEISKLILILLYFVFILRILIVIPFWYKNN